VFHQFLLGTLFEDYRTPIELAKANEHKLAPLWERGLKKAYEEVKVEEEKKHQKRARILAKFRNKRLKNALREKKIDYEYKRNPIIFTPNADTPFNPNYGDMEDRTTADLMLFERLAVPKFRCQTPTPNGRAVDETSSRILDDIQDLKNMRRFYHWKNQVNMARGRPESGYLSSSRTFSGYSSARPFSAISKDGLYLDDEFKEDFSLVETKQDRINKKHSESTLVFSDVPTLSGKMVEECFSEIESFEKRLRDLH